MFQMPSHIERTNIVAKPIDFEWVDGDETDYYNRLSKQLTNKLMKLSPRAGLALTAGLAEWVVWRLSGFDSYNDVKDFVEASWASVIDSRYTIEWTRRDKELKGPVLGPQWIAARMLDSVMVDTWDREGTIRHSQYLAFLCQHVWKSRKLIKNWMLSTFDRLIALYPVSPITQDYYELEDPTGDEPFEFGDIVPREAMDPEFNYKPEDTPVLLDTFLQGLRPSSNRFLRNPKQMIKMGFEGTPYRYPLKATTPSPEKE